MIIIMGGKEGQSVAEDYVEQTLMSSFALRFEIIRWLCVNVIAICYYFKQQRILDFYGISQ